MVKKLSFDLFFAGSDNKVWREYLIANNCNRLASWINDKAVLDEWIKAGAPGKLFIDSGAYSAHTTGKEVDVDKYIELVNSLDEMVYVFAQVDKIPGVFRQEKTAAQCLEAPMLSWKNYLYMRERVKSPDKLLPIFHQNEDFDWLHNMLEAKFDGKHIPYIGVSPANDKSTKEKNEWFETVFKIIKSSSNPNVKTHAFGMTSLPVLERYPFTSADSTSFIMTGANGGIMTSHGTIVVSENQVSNPNFIFNKDKAEVDFLLGYIKDMGFNIETLQTDYEQRIVFNIAYLKQWADNYQYKGTQIYRKSLFDIPTKSQEEHELLIKKANEQEEIRNQELQEKINKSKEIKMSKPEVFDENFSKQENEEIINVFFQRSDFGNMTTLGASETKYPTSYNPQVLEYFENQHSDKDYVVKFEAYEFSSLCPKTQQPDFAKIYIKYIPDTKMVESKSLKLYLFSFRNHGDFHEDCVNKICNDLVELMSPKYLEVKGVFTPRGGISINPFVTYSNGEDTYKQIENKRTIEELGNF